MMTETWDRVATQRWRIACVHLLLAVMGDGSDHSNSWNEWVFRVGTGLLMGSWVMPAGKPCLIWAGVAIGLIVAGLGGECVKQALRQRGWFPVTEEHLLKHDVYRVGCMQAELLTDPALLFFWQQQRFLLWRDLLRLELVEHIHWRFFYASERVKPRIAYFNWAQKQGMFNGYDENQPRISRARIRVRSTM
jgi:hypothetical protein